MPIPQRVNNIRLFARRAITSRTLTDSAVGYRSVVQIGGQKGDIRGIGRTYQFGDITIIPGSVMLNQAPAAEFSAGARDLNSRGTISLAWELLPAALNLSGIDDLVGWATKLSGQLGSAANTERTELLVGQGGAWRRVISIENVQPDRQADLVSFTVTVAPPIPNTEPPVDLHGDYTDATTGAYTNGS